jgi:hypothetical protein
MNYYVCSWGGSGSKMLCSYLSNFGKTFHIHSRKPPVKLTGVGVNTYVEWFNNIEIPEDEIKNYKVIFIYRNPIDSIYSRFENFNHLDHIQTKRVTLSQVIDSKKDLYELEEFFHNYKYKKNRNYDITLVKYEDFFEKIEEFNSVLELPNIKEYYPKKIETKKDINKEEVKKLYEVYENLIFEMNNMEFIEKSK